MRLLARASAAAVGLAFAFALAVGLASPLAAQQSRDLKFEAAPPVNPLGDKGTRWALIIGVSQHEQLPPGAQLQFAHRDAESFAAFLRSPAGGALPSSHIRLLTNQQATLSAIRAALHNWLPQSAGADDIVYVFFAGHGVLAERDEGYFIATDSDPQNLHATALSFAEVDRTLNQKLHAASVILALDACHAGRLGWASFSPNLPSRASDAIQQIGGDRSVLKLLASRTSERSFEDVKFGGGHGIFTYSLLEGLRGQADRDGDRFIRISELTDYVSQNVSTQTQAQQHPRVAGTFDARLPLAVLPELPKAPPSTVALDVQGPAGAEIYLDHQYRGSLRSDGFLRIEGIAAGLRAFGADLPDGTTIDGGVRLQAANSRLDLPVSGAMTQLRKLVALGQTQQAWDFYRAQPFQGNQRSVATAVMSAALEESGQACVSDYVQSTQLGPKRALLLRAVDSFEKLKTLRPDDPAIETRRLFCQGRLQIAGGQFKEALVSLGESLRRDPNFACAHNALGVALLRSGRGDDARKEFEVAARLTPEWGLPQMQLADQLVAGGKAKDAFSFYEKAVKFSPQSRGNRWSLAKAYRMAGRLGDARKASEELIRLDALYAPAYLELGQTFEAEGDYARAAAAYDAYTQLAPNYSDSNEIRVRSQRLKDSSRKSLPSLRKQ